MEKVGVRVKDRELVLLMAPEEVHQYLAQRRIKLAGVRTVDLAEALNVKPQQATALLSGRVPFGRKMIQRLNSIDREYEMVELIGIIRREGTKRGDGDI